MKLLLTVAAAALVVFLVGAGIALYYLFPHEVIRYTIIARSYIHSWTAPAGTTTTELNPAYEAPGIRAPKLAPVAPLANAAVDGEWPSYNRTLTSERYSPLDEINPKTVEKLKVICTYDTKQFSNFESGLIMVNGALIGTTEFDIFSIDPVTCAENWRTHENIPPSYYMTNRGPSYLDGRLFRGFQNGRVRAYAFKTGKPIWETAIADPKLGEFRAGRPDRLERPRFRRQRLGRRQGRQGTGVRA